MSIFRLVLRILLLICVLGHLEAQEKSSLGKHFFARVPAISRELQQQLKSESAGTPSSSPAAAPSAPMLKREERAYKVNDDFLDLPVADSFYCGDTDKLKVNYLFHY